MDTFPDDNTFLIGLAGGLLLILVLETVGVICFICKVVHSIYLICSYSQNSKHLYKETISNSFIASQVRSSARRRVPKVDTNPVYGVEDEIDPSDKNHRLSSLDQNYDYMG